MSAPRLLTLAACALTLSACLFESGGPLSGSPEARSVKASPDAGAPDVLDRIAARKRFATTTDLMRYVVAPGCAAERNECHNSEDFPDLSTEGNLWNLVGVRCNLGLGERNEVEDACEALGDQVRIDTGANAGFTARLGSVTTVTNPQGAFQYYELLLDTAPTANQTGATFSLLRDGTRLEALGGGTSGELQAGQKWLRVKNATHLKDTAALRQGDENRNGTFGTGQGVLVKPGDAHGSYLVRRLQGQQTNRVRMPLGANPDNLTETVRPLTRNEAYSLMSWINCMQEGDGPYAPIRYDCPQNAQNDGSW